MILFFAALIQAASPEAIVQQRIAPDAELNACLAVDDPASADDPVKHIVACYEAAQGRADAALDAGYAKLRAGFAGKEAALVELDRGAAAFRFYRDIWCKIDEAAETDPRMIKATAMMCRLELTRYQIYRIDSVG